MDLKPGQIERLFKKQIRGASPGAAICITHRGVPVYKNAWGLSSIENPLPLTTQSVFNSGSLAKQFTAFAIFQLQQSRKLSIDDEVRRHIPELPSYRRPLKIRHLLWHSSGLRCYTTMLWWGGVAQRDNYSRKQALELICRQKELNFQPGEEYLYGNSNYLLLAEIVERASGKSIADFCRKIIFDPMGMKDTHFRDKPSLPVKNLVSGHFEWGQQQILVNRNLGAPPGVGRLMTHVEDLARWEKFFFRPEKSLRAVQRGMLTRGYLDSGQTIRYGGGLMFQRYRGLDMVRHDGFTSGCRGEFCRFPAKETSISCLANTTEISPTWMIRQVADILWGRELEPVSALGPGQPAPPAARAKVPAAALRQREGLYRAEANGPFAELQLKDGALRFRTMHVVIDMAPESPVAFQGSGAGKICRFDFEDDGGFIFTKQGRAVRYGRLDGPGKRGAEGLERFEGRYASPELVSRMDVKAKGGKLWLIDPTGFEWELKRIKGPLFYNYFREIRFSARGMTMEGADHWVRRLKWVKL